MKLSSLAPEHLECRSMGHAWTHVDDRDHLMRAGVLTRFMRDERCLRCNADRTREVDLSKSYLVAVRTVRIHYPEGYLIRQPRRRVTRGDALGAQYRRDVEL